MVVIFVILLVLVLVVVDALIHWRRRRLEQRKSRPVPMPSEGR
jgi:hypothetical protein